MRCAYRNMQPIWYALYDQTVERYDEYGNQDATYTTYGKPVMVYANVSPARGAVAARQFGEDEQYDKVIVLGDRDTPIDEYAVLWIDTEPVLDEDGNTQTPWDYTVRRVARGLPGFGSATIAVSKVNVS